MKVFKCDTLIVGGGIAGLTAALHASKSGKVILITKGKTKETATEKAQGGIAAAIDNKHDSTKLHLEDTLIAGAGLCDKKAVEILVKEGVLRVKELIEMGADFDKASGGFELNIEGAHRQRRILHAGDYTGSEIARTLAARVLKEKLVEIKNYIFGKDILMSRGKCKGIIAYDFKSKEDILILAKATILSTGGACQIYQYTTNPEFATGDGIAMAYRAGAYVSDMEFVQFHPTALVQFKGIGEEIAFPQFLISEAVRGEGAVLLNSKGKRFMDKYHIQAELAPRDIVARAIFEEMQKTGSDHVHLNMSGIDPEKVKKRFPTIYKTCKEAGFDLTNDDIPVAPAAHYLMGGIKTDLRARTSIPGLWAAGEAMSSGVHGANRLASNSLLEGVVFGHKAAVDAAEFIKTMKNEKSDEKAAEYFIRQKRHSGKMSPKEIRALKNRIKRLMWDNVGIVRNKAGLIDTILELRTIQSKCDFHPETFEEIELRNMSLVGYLVTRAALNRKESRGAHFRSDYPASDNQKWKKHLKYRLKSTA